MGSITLDGVRKVFGDGTVAVRDVSLEIGGGEFVVFVGPSGCGKSTLLRMIAGLEPISAGQVRIDGRVINDMPPRDRDVAMVFQNYALYPHMSVRENIGFALEQRRLGRAEIDKRVTRRRASSTSACCSIASPSSSPAVNASAWRWAAPSCAIRRPFCSTNRYPISTPSCACNAGRTRQAPLPPWRHHHLTLRTTRSRR